MSPIIKQLERLLVLFATNSVYRASAISADNSSVPDDSLVALTALCYKQLPCGVQSLTDDLRTPTPALDVVWGILRQRKIRREEAGEWEVTVRGGDMRCRMEDQTNEFKAQPFVALDEGLRAELLSMLSRLPDCV